MFDNLCIFALNTKITHIFDVISGISYSIEVGHKNSGVWFLQVVILI